jgi:hypothetical protein
LIFTVALTAGAAEAGSEMPRQTGSPRKPGAPAAQRFAGAGAPRASWRSHGSAQRKENVRVASIDGTNVTFQRADGSLVTVKLALIKHEGRRAESGSLLRVNATASLKLRLGGHGEILGAKLKPKQR